MRCRRATYGKRDAVCTRCYCSSFLHEVRRDAALDAPARPGLRRGDKAKAGGDMMKHRQMMESRMGMMEMMMEQMLQRMQMMQSVPSK